MFFWFRFKYYQLALWAPNRVCLMSLSAQLLPETFFEDLQNFRLLICKLKTFCNFDKYILQFWLVLMRTYTFYFICVIVL